MRAQLITSSRPPLNHRVLSSLKPLASLRFRAPKLVSTRRYCSNMRSSSREEVVEVLDALEAGYKRALDLTFDVLTTPERLAVLERFEGFRRQLPAIEHALVNQLAEQADPTELGGRLAPALANRLRISRAEAARRVHDAEDLGERRALTGEPLAPVLPATAGAQRNGHLRAGHG